MTAARKNLGDIANRALAMLEKIENSQEERLERVAHEQAISRKSGDGSSLASVEARARELEQDVKTYLEESTGRLEKAFQAEMSETEEHYAGVKNDINKLADRLKGSITELKKSYQENLAQLSVSLTEQFEGSIERSTAELERQEYNSTKGVSGHGMVVINTLQQKLDHTLWESRGEEKKYNSTLFKGFMQRANTIDSHFSNLMQKLSADFQEQFDEVESQAQQVEGQLEQQSGDLLRMLEKESQEIDHSTDETYRSRVEKHVASLDLSLTTKAQDLSTVHDATTKKLTEQTKDLSAGLVSAAGEARESLAGRCAQLKETMEGQVSLFRSRMDERLQATQTLKDAMEEEKLAIVENMQKELGEIWQSFEKRMSTLTTEALARLRALAEDAEKSMVTEHKTCLGRIRLDGQAANKEISESIEKFLELLAQQRSMALEEIAKSSENQLISPAKAEPSKPRRVRKTKENPQPEVEG